MRSQTTPRGRSPSLAKIVILALVGVLLLSQFGLWGGSEEDRDPIQHGAHFAVRNLQNGAAHERDGSVDEKQRDPPSPPYGEQETDPNFEVVDVFAENIPPKKQEVDEVLPTTISKRIPYITHLLTTVGEGRRKKPL